jgi:hypothetical protein
VKLPITEEQAFDAQQAADTAALNGVVYLAMLLRRHDLVAAPELVQLHAMMSKPLTLSGRAANPVVQIIQQHLDEQFATILSQVVEE